ncbi:MAG: hypothetical protein ACI4VJ_00560 [Methanosphaera sp.]
MNSKGQLIITDLMLYLILLTIILGIIIYTIDNINDNQVSSLNNHETDQILTDTLNTIIKTEGTPSNWENESLNNIKIIGLRKNSTSSMISYDKLMKLKSNNQLLSNLLPTGTNYELSIHPKNNPNHNTIIVTRGSVSSDRNVYSMEAPVIIDYGYNISSIYNHNYSNTCPLHHEKDNKEWSCKAFNINKSTLNKGTYYIIVDKDTDYILTNTYNETITGKTEDNITEINQKLEQLIRDDNDTIYIHIHSNKKQIYLAYDTNNRKNYLNSIKNPQIYILTLKIST